MSKEKLIRTYELYRAPDYPKFDEQGRPHCEFGPAIMVVSSDVLNIEGDDVSWKDGKMPQIDFAPEGDERGCVVYAYHGISIPIELAKTIIDHPENLTVSFIEEIKNNEIKRIAIERFGIGKYLEQSGAKVLDERTVERVKSPKGGTVKLTERLVKRQVAGATFLGVFVVNSTPNGIFNKSVEAWVPLDTFSEDRQKELKLKYENTGDIRPIDGKLHLRQVKEDPESFVPELDAEGNYVYKTYYLNVHPEVRPFWFELNKDGSYKVSNGERVQGLGEPQKPTVHNAIASTFGLYGDEYSPDVEA